MLFYRQGQVFAGYMSHAGYRYKYPVPMSHQKAEVLEGLFTEG